MNNATRRDNEHSRLSTGTIRIVDPETDDKNKRIYFRFIRRSAAPIIAKTPSSMPRGDTVFLTVATVVGMVVIIGAVVVAGVSLADNDDESPYTTTFVIQSS